MGPPFIDGGSNPFGNKGADLIETIRLEGHRDGPGIYLGSAGVRRLRREVRASLARAREVPW